MRVRDWRKLLAALGLVAVVDISLCSPAAEAQSADAHKPDGVTFTLYPLLLRAPLMGATLKFPAPPDGGGGGGGGGDDTGSTGVSLNNAWMAGASVESRRWFAETFGLWAALSASRATPLVSLDTDTYFFTGRAGVGLGGGLSATVGFRRVSADLHAALDRPSDGTTLEASTKPVLWDPLIGVDWRGPIAKRWRLAANFQGGGFGVGTDLDVSAEAYASWHPLKHFEIRGGYTVVHYKMTLANLTVNSVNRTLISTQTLYGPEFGIGIPF